MSAVATKGGVLVRWRVPAIADVLGFHVWRSAGGAYRKVNTRLIPGSPAGRLSFVDRNAPRHKLRYKLQVVAPDGRVTWVGPVRVSSERL